MRFVTFEDVARVFRDRTVAIVGSGPSCLDNVPGEVDAHEVVVRVNNFKLGSQQGRRMDVHYSFYGTSIHSKPDEMLRAGTQLCMCKCPDAKALESEWHERNNKQIGIDYRYIYKNRASWWFCDTFVPDVPRYRRKFDVLKQHIPTTGIAAVMDVLDCAPRSIYLTGFDFFSSGVHNVNEPWKPGNPDDPIGHSPNNEAEWLWRTISMLPDRFRLDAKLNDMLMRSMV